MESKVIEDGYFKVYKDGTIYGLNAKGNYVRKIPTVITTNRNKQYNYVSAYKKGHGQRHAKVDRLIAEAFIPNPNNKPIITHIDGNSLNDSIENLAWVTPKEMTMMMKQRGKGVSLKSHGVPCEMCGELTLAKDCLCRNCKTVIKLEGSSENKRKEMIEKFKNIDMSILSIREQYVVEQRIEGKTLEEIGTSLKITRERIRQIEQKLIFVHNARKRVLEKINKNGANLMDLNDLEIVLNKNKEEMSILLGISRHKYSIISQNPKHLTLDNILIIQKELDVKTFYLEDEKSLHIEIKGGIK